MSQKLSPTMKRALDAIRDDENVKRRGFVTWETGNPVYVDEPGHVTRYVRVSYSTLEALTKRGYLRREYLGSHRVSGQRIPRCFGRSWRRGYITFAVRYHLTGKKDS